MGTIKDLVDLVTQLSNSVEDRKFAGELRQIQSMIGSIQSENATLHEQRIELMAKNADLKDENASLKQRISILQQKIVNSKNTEAKAAKRPFPEEAEDILLFLAKHESTSAQQIACSISLDISKTEYWLDEFSNKDFVYFPSHIGARDKRYYLAKKGLSYLINNKILCKF